MRGDPGGSQHSEVIWGLLRCIARELVGFLERIGTTHSRQRHLAAYTTTNEREGKPTEAAANGNAKRSRGWTHPAGSPSYSIGCATSGHHFPSTKTSTKTHVGGYLYPRQTTICCNHIGVAGIHELDLHFSLLRRLCPSRR